MNYVVDSTSYCISIVACSSVVTAVGVFLLCHKSNDVVIHKSYSSEVTNTEVLYWTNEVLYITLNS